MFFQKGGSGSMIIAGEWRVCDDGITRPTVPAKVQAADGTYHVEFFLVDSCADHWPAANCRRAGA